MFTLGRRGGKENLVVTETFLARHHIPIVHVERGGNITYHGPGQLVGYLVVQLRKSKLSVVDFVSGLETLMMRTAADFGVQAQRDDRNRGIWVGNNKLGSIGIHVRRGVSFHGFALNVNLDLTPFSWINPCGLSAVGVTSICQEQTDAEQTISVEVVQKQAVNHLSTVFGATLTSIDLIQLQEMSNEYDTKNLF